MMVSNVRPNLKEEELVTEQPEQLLTPATEPRGKNLEDLQAMTEDPKSPFPFLKLPYDLRYRIYCMTLIFINQPVPIAHPSTRTQLSFSNSLPFKPQPTSIFYTCKQIYHETAPFYYSQNDFTTKDQVQLRLWLGSIGAMGLRNLRSLTIPLFRDEDLAFTYDHLREIKGLRNLTLCVRWDIFFCQHQVIDDAMRVKGLDQLLKLRGVEKVVVHVNDGYKGNNSFLTIWKKSLEDALQVMKIPK